MFPDGIQRKSTDFEKVNCDTKTSRAEQLKTRLDNKITSIQNGIKEDLAKSVTRWLQGTTKSVPSSETRSSVTNGSMNTKSKLNNNAINRRSSFGFGGKLEGDKYRQVNLADRLARVKSFQVNTDSSNQSWVPSLTSLNQSLSLRKQNKASTGGSKLKRGWKLEKSKGNVLHEAKQHFKRDISSQVNKYDTWRNGINKGSLSLFIVISIILGLVIQCVTLTSGAPLPPSVITPIWLQDKLISLDLSLFENPEPNLPLESVSTRLNSANQLEQLLHRIEDLTDNQRLSSISEKAPSTALFNNLEESTLKQQQNQQGDHDVKESLVFDDNYNDNSNNEGLLRPVESQGEELFWIERRRLERDRSLEPPPWLREQPMRRGFGPIESSSEFNVQDQSNRKLGTSSSFKPQEAEWSQFGERTLGRKSRQSNDQIYEEILRYILEEAHDNRPILDELYDELELRLKANQRPLSITSQQTNIVSPLKSNDKQKSQRLIKQGEQNHARNSDDSNGPDLLNSQPETSDADSTLVVVGDEVSSGDDVTPLEDTSNLRSNNGINSYGNEDGVDKTSSASNSPINDGISEGVGAHTKPVLDLSKLTGSGLPDVYFAGPERISNGALLVNVDPVSDSDEQLLQQIPNSNSFHVIEDIDQADNSQISTAYSTIDNDNDQMQQQQQQNQKVLEQTELISSPSEEKRSPIRDYKFYPLTGMISPEKMQIKGGTAILQPNKQIPDDRKEALSSDNKIEVSETQQQQKYNITDDVPLAIKLIESGYLNKDQLIWAATELKYRLESALGLTKGTILGLYPMNTEQLLIKLDTAKLTPYQIVSMIQNYGKFKFERIKIYCFTLFDRNFGTKF